MTNVGKICLFCLQPDTKIDLAGDFPHLLRKERKWVPTHLDDPRMHVVT